MAMEDIIYSICAVDGELLPTRHPYEYRNSMQEDPSWPERSLQVNISHLTSQESCFIYYIDLK